MKWHLIVFCMSTIPAIAETPKPNYPISLTDFKSAHCDFDAMTAPPSPAVSLDLKRSDATDNILWFQDGQMPMPILSGLRMPTHFTSFVAPVTDGTMDMVSYAETGQAKLTRHGSNGQGGILWTTQVGTCREEKGE